MTTPLPVSPAPYVTPELLVQAPTGISWTTIPPGGVRSGVTQAQKTAELSNICQRATTLVDGCVRQPLRATTDPLLLYGPGAPRVGVPRNGCAEDATLIMTRWPVLEVVSVQYARNRLPYTWSTVPSGLAVGGPPATRPTMPHSLTLEVAHLKTPNFSRPFSPHFPLAPPTLNCYTSAIPN